ncbi:bifunctional proline dehydrogenase/L-glutamate gamma-semialdehyde dehydrogenase PutA [Nitrogeniibacter aestuarii]|uniref:bifunctional proline dehydrogenase/L-glutamate gamma-semialdehyde dehydrogenase PutA n=1 Tax=Nitrogeniibacter aestuarii TaxID=2815343 RepID=UPI002AB305BF|nr:bifunctional proline dehydrogenase/L-glutamate gamma-semialdehyde dehydrogenase PutA [Nitrogeniibacter aestuarii]
MMPTPMARDAAALPEGPRGPLRRAIDAAWRLPEAECLPPLLLAARLTDEQAGQARSLARALVSGIREKRMRAPGVDALMKEFSLSSQEGVALMCLAESLLRIPDRETADQLIRDKLAEKDWAAHLGHSPSMFVNAAAWGLLLTGRVVRPHEATGLAAAVGRLVQQGGEPLIRRGMDMAMHLLGEQFVMAEDIDAALLAAPAGEAKGYRYSFDMLGEAAMTMADADCYDARYRDAIEVIGKANAGRSVIEGHGISIKLSALHPRYEWSQRDRVMAELLPRVRALFVQARAHGLGVNIDAEEADRLDLSLDLFEALAMDPVFAGWDGLGFVVQAYQKRAPYVLDFLVGLARRSGHRLMVRLVKGAYWDSEIKHAQVAGASDYPVFTRKVFTDVSYLACARKLLEARDLVYPQFATHNAYSVAAIMQMAGGQATAEDFEFQCLFGMGESLYDQVVGPDQLDRQVRIYAPIGDHRSLLPYLVRRLLENGANSSFVNRIVDERIPVDALISDPVVSAVIAGDGSNPNIPPPASLFGEQRRNSLGLDLASEPVREAFGIALQDSYGQMPTVAPMVDGVCPSHSSTEAVRNPADTQDIVGNVVVADSSAVEQALCIAMRAAEGWAFTPVSARADLLDRMADALESDPFPFMALAVREAGKTWGNAHGEVREAVDFCRYYAAQARQTHVAAETRPLGPVVCISPWNFPLAIFVGQVAAALVAGNPVIAKPAGQTPLIAARAVGLFHAVGVPTSVLQCLPGPGRRVGAALVADERVKGVIFTGLTATARQIARALAARGGDIPLVAETGGQNAMIVDSSALPEQVIADVMSSAFDSAGQRCSALRVLCLQEDVADAMLDMLRGAVRQLRVGDPADVRTDIGPVIDAGALVRLQSHVAGMRAVGMPVEAPPLSEALHQGHFMSPTLIEIDSLERLDGEVFGPVLHVLRYKASELAALVAKINATGYGLTLGIYSRIDARIHAVVKEARAGNIYVNRNMIGAVVGVQPFGGEGCSGTGPKAGGPFYLSRLTRHAAPPLNSAEPVGNPLLDVFESWLSDGDVPGLSDGVRSALIGIAARYASQSPVGLEWMLTGPTGEQNCWKVVPRRRVAGVSECARGVLHQLAAALATGNRLLLNDVPMARSLFAQAPAQVTQRLVWVPNVLEAAPELVLFDGAVATADAMRRQLAEGEGGLVPLVTPSPHYDLMRLVVERTVTVNTTAAGGNASLMSLGD